MSGDEEYDVWPNTVELCFGRVRIFKYQALEYLKRLGVAACTLDALFEVPDDGQTVYWVTFKASTDHAAFLERHGVERTQKLGDLDVKIACADKSRNYRDVLLSKIPPNFNLEVIKTVLRNFGKVTKCDWEVYQDRAMGDLVGCKTGYVKIRMVVDKHIPSYVNVGAYRCYVTYRGQPITCRHCDERGHVFNECPKRRVRRGPPGQGSHVVPVVAPSPPSHPTPPVSVAKQRTKTGGGKPNPRSVAAPTAREQLAWADVVSNKRKGNECISDPNSKHCRSNSVGEAVAKSVNAPVSQEEVPVSVPEPRTSTSIENVLTNLTNIFDELDNRDGPATGKTHVSETQVLSKSTDDTMDFTRSDPAAVSLPLSIGDSVVIERRPKLPALGSTLFEN